VNLEWFVLELRKPFWRNKPAKKPGLESAAEPPKFSITLHFQQNSDNPGKRFLKTSAFVLLLKAEVKNIFCAGKEIFLVNRQSLTIAGFRQPEATPLFSEVFAAKRPRSRSQSSPHYEKRSTDAHQLLALERAE
jgi:hypothetical protein